ncbi:MAG: 2Fe-2S iron-sulfur cluster-binding protein [Nitrospinaceae bacterium]
MLDTIIGLAALVFLVLLIRYVLQLTSERVRVSSITKRGFELEADLLRARIDQITDQLRLDFKSEKAFWNGFRKFQIILKVKETKDVTSFYLSPHDGKHLPPFLPGQYLTFKLNIPGRTKPLIRCYSLSDSPNHPEYYRVTIKRLPPPKGVPGAPPGLGSNFFHHSLKERDIVDVKAPSGHFHLDTTQTTPVVLISGGVGVTPILSMLNAITEKGFRREFFPRETWLFLGFRNGSDHIMKEHLENVVNKNKNVSLHVCYSRPCESDILGRDFHHPRRISGNLLRQVLPSNNYEFYICAPPKMIESLRQDLAGWGVPKKNIHYEAFNSDTVRKLVAGEITETGSSIKITFTKSQKTLPWNPAAGSILAFAEENGISLESGCRAGNCGTCLTAIKRGLVTYVVEPGIQPEARSCLTCISIPKTDLTLDG